MTARQDLIEYVIHKCVRLNNQRNWLAQSQWCEQHVGECRPGDIFQEAQEGWIDYFDGDWQLIQHNGAHDMPAGWVFWFANKSDQTQFQLTWS